MYTLTNHSLPKEYMHFVGRRRVNSASNRKFQHPFTLDEDASSDWSLEKLTRECSNYLVIHVFKLKP